MCRSSHSHRRHGLVLEGDERHAQRFGVDFLLLLPVLLFQFGLQLGVITHSLLLQNHTDVQLDCITEHQQTRASRNTLLLPPRQATHAFIQGHAVGVHQTQRTSAA